MRRSAPLTTPWIEKSRAKCKVKVTIRRDIEKQKLRMRVSEHPFGMLKWYDGYYYFLCRGKEKATAETALAYLGYNMRRAMNILGVKKLTEYFQGRAMQK